MAPIEELLFVSANKHTHTHTHRPGLSAARAAALSLNKQVLVAVLARQQASNQAAFAGMHAARVQLPQRHMNKLGLSEQNLWPCIDTCIALGTCRRCGGHVVNTMPVK